MKLVRFFLIFFIVGFFSVFAYRFFIVRRFEASFTPKYEVFHPAVPSAALSGTLNGISGSVSKLSRTDTDYKPASDGDSFFQGESLKTSPDSSALLTFPNYLKLSLSQNSSFNLINSLPSSFLINQTQGEVDYTLTDSANPVSVRLLHLLVQLESGSLTISQNGSLITLIPKGSVTIAYNNLNNVTQLVNLTRKTVYNDSTRTLTHPRR